MQFNTLQFLWFCAAILALYWICYRRTAIQNVLLLLGSYYFYSRLNAWFPVFLGALTVTSYAFGMAMERVARSRKALLATGLVLLSSCLVILKYSNLAIETANVLGGSFELLNLIAPVGLSFYTLSSIGYLVDVYRRQVRAERNLIAYGAYVSFFPHLLAGPIPSATSLLPQFRQERRFRLAQLEPAVQQILWGLFKKMVIADNISISVNYCFAHIGTLNSFGLYLGIVLFSFQIYADFSGYSDVARGVASLFGIDLFANFKSPFLSRNPAEFWRRWHTSLTRWLTEYLYKPLGGRSDSMPQYVATILFIFGFSGLWHGANWTFVLWGLLNGFYFLPYLLTGTLVRYKEPPCPGRKLPDLKTFLQIALTFHLITLSRILFKSSSVTQARDYFVGLLTQHHLSMPPAFLFTYLPWCALLVILEWVNRSRSNALDVNGAMPIRFAVYGAVTAGIIFFHKVLSLQEYYYFRF